MSSIQKCLEKTKKLWKTHSPCFALTLKRNSTDRKANTKIPKHFFAIIAEQVKKNQSFSYEFTIFILEFAIESKSFLFKEKTIIIFHQFYASHPNVCILSCVGTCVFSNCADAHRYRQIATPNSLYQTYAHSCRCSAPLHRRIKKVCVQYAKRPQLGTDALVAKQE